MLRGEQVRGLSCTGSWHAEARLLALGGGDTIRDVDERAPPWDIDGPVQAEVYVIWLDGDHIAWTGPCGPAPWLLELGAADHPLEVVDRIVRDTIGPPLLVHSTSWRRDRDAVILSFVVVIEPGLVADMESIRVDRAELARSAATAAPRQIDHRQVIEHGLRHLAWLAVDDPVVRDTLSDEFRAVLAGYAPEPFRALG